MKSGVGGVKDEAYEGCEHQKGNTSVSDIEMRAEVNSVVMSLYCHGY